MTTIYITESISDEQIAKIAQAVAERLAYRLMELDHSIDGAAAVILQELKIMASATEKALQEVIANVATAGQDMIGRFNAKITELEAKLGDSFDASDEIQSLRDIASGFHDVLAAAPEIKNVTPDTPVPQEPVLTAPVSDVSAGATLPAPVATTETTAPLPGAPEGDPGTPPSPVSGGSLV